MTALSTGQRLLLGFMSEPNSRIWRSPQGYKLTRERSTDITLTEGTVQAMVDAGVIRETESYGRDRGLYEISDAGKQALRSKKRAS